MINWCQVEANYTIKLIIIIEMKPPGYVSTEGRPTSPFAPLPLMCRVKDYQLFPDMQAMLNNVLCCCTMHNIKGKSTSTIKTGQAKIGFASPI